MGTQTNQECDISMWAGKLIWKEAQFWNDYLFKPLWQRMYAPPTYHFVPPQAASVLALSLLVV